MTDIAKHVRIFCLTADDDYVSKRTAAIKTIEDAFRKKLAFTQIFELADELVRGIYSPTTTLTVVNEIAGKALQKQSASFVAEEEQLQIITCALVAILQMLEKSTSITRNLNQTDAIAICLWNALSFRGPITGAEKLESLRQELLQNSQRVVDACASSSRSRNSITLPNQIKAPADNNLQTLASDVKAAYEPILQNLISNAALDREEINVLWWVLNEYSEITSCKLTTNNDVQNIAVCGLELAKLLRRLPSVGHRNLILRFISGTKSISGKEFMLELGDKLNQIQVYINAIEIVKQRSSLFPLCNAIINDKVDVDGLEIKRPFDEWASRMLFEGTMIVMDTFMEDGE